MDLQSGYHTRQCARKYRYGVERMIAVAHLNRRLKVRHGKSANVHEVRFTTPN
jgi:hypothetical protein